MRYLVSVIDDKSNPGSTDRRPAISAFNEQLIAEGCWVFAGGLASPDTATVIDNRGEQAVVLGLRPEDVCAAEAVGPGLTLAGVVDSVLPVGSDRFLGLKVEGSDVFVRVDKEARHQEGAAIGLGLVAERLHLFDKASGLTLGGEGAP